MLEEPTLRKTVEFAVETEKLGALFYEKMASKLKDDEEVNDIFSRLAKDENIHRAQFQKLLDTIPNEAEVSSRRDEQLAMLKLLSRSDFFMGEEGVFREVDRIRTREDALERAFRLEKDTLLYYRELKEVLGESEILNEIINAEKSHLVKVNEYMITGAKMRGLGDRYP